MALNTGMEFQGDRTLPWLPWKGVRWRERGSLYGWHSGDTAGRRCSKPKPVHFPGDFLWYFAFDLLNNFAEGPIEDAPNGNGWASPGPVPVNKTDHAVGPGPHHVPNWECRRPIGSA